MKKFCLVCKKDISWGTKGSTGSHIYAGGFSVCNTCDLNKGEIWEKCQCGRVIMLKEVVNYCQFCFEEHINESKAKNLGKRKER